MLRIENHCCECATPGYPCRGNACELRHVEVHYCDRCGDELKKIFDKDGGEYCRDCYKEINEE